MEPRPELQGNEPVKVRGAVSGFRSREQKGQRPQDRSELVAVRTRKKFCETEWQPGALPLGEAWAGLPVLGLPHYRAW